jgi:hypothetical protein
MIFENPSLGVGCRKSTKNARDRCCRVSVGAEGAPGDADLKDVADENERGRRAGAAEKKSLWPCLRAGAKDVVIALERQDRDSEDSGGLPFVR